MIGLALISAGFALIFVAVMCAILPVITCGVVLILSGIIYIIIDVCIN